MQRREFITLLGGATAAWPLIARAQTYPMRPIFLVVGYASGGLTDIIARWTGRWLSERLNNLIAIENKPGADSNLATELVANAPPDGYRLLLVTATSAINASLYDKLSFNFIRDIAPVAGIIRVPHVLTVNPILPVKTLPEFIAYTKSNADTVKFASGGNGTMGHLAGELFKTSAGTNMLHVPYAGPGPAVTNVIDGHAQAAFEFMPASIEHIRAGKLRALAVTTAARSELLPELPTLSEFLPEYEASSWYGVGAPKKMPPEIVDRLNKEINAGIGGKLNMLPANFGGIVLSGSPADFGKQIADETEKWAKVILTNNIRGNPTTPGNINSTTLVELFPDLTDLPRTPALAITIEWVGYSPISPFRANYSLSLLNSQFQGEGKFEVAGGATAKESASRAIAIPREVVQAFLTAANKVKMIEGQYAPRFIYTDSYPSLIIEIQTKQGMLKIKTASQPEAHYVAGVKAYDSRTPWAIEYLGRTFVVNANDLDQAMQPLEPLLQSAEVFKELVDRINSRRNPPTAAPSVPGGPH
jgi:tripartite-type tricarboxylate transporter receptor subunit TctC